MGGIRPPAASATGVPAAAAPPGRRVGRLQAGHPLHVHLVRIHAQDDGVQGDRAGQCAATTGRAGGTGRLDVPTDGRGRDAPHHGHQGRPPQGGVRAQLQGLARVEGRAPVGPAKQVVHGTGRVQDARVLQRPARAGAHPYDRAAAKRQLQRAPDPGRPPHPAGSRVQDVLVWGQADEGGQGRGHGDAAGQSAGGEEAHVGRPLGPHDHARRPQGRVRPRHDVAVHEGPVNDSKVGDGLEGRGHARRAQAGGSRPEEAAAQVRGRGLAACQARVHSGALAQAHPAAAARRPHGVHR